MRHLGNEKRGRFQKKHSIINNRRLKARTMPKTNALAQKERTARRLTEGWKRFSRLLPPDVFEDVSIYTRERMIAHKKQL